MLTALRRIISGGRLALSLLMALAACVHPVAAANQRSHARNPDVKVRISFPSNNALVRADVPIFGIADCPDFRSWRLECTLKYDERGQKIEPDWRLFAESDTPVREDPWTAGKVHWDYGHGARGNLFTWPTGAPSYPYTTYETTEQRGICRLRLSVFDAHGTAYTDEITVQVADVFSNVYGGFTESPDGIVEIRLPTRSTPIRFFLVGVTALSQLEHNAPPDDVGLEPLGLIYEVQPPGALFTKPATLRIRAPDAQALQDRSVSIYWYDWLAARWVRCESEADETSRSFSARVTSFPKGRAFYGLFRDVAPPESPRIEQHELTTDRIAILLSGTAEPQAALHAYRGEALAGQTHADHRGRFRIRLEPLSDGENLFVLYAQDAAGHRSEAGTEVNVRRINRSPLEVDSLHVTGPAEAVPGELYIVRMRGKDRFPDTVDTACVRVERPALGESHLLELIETAPDSGIYENHFRIIDASSTHKAHEPELLSIAVERDGEEVVVATDFAPGLTRRLTYRDRTGPTRPRVDVVPQYKFVCWTFEEPEQEILAAWESVDGALGAGLSVETDAHGNRFLKLTQQQDSSHLGVRAPLKTPVHLENFPLLSFDYMIPRGVGIDLYFRAPGSNWRTIKLCNPYDAFNVIGRVPEIVADGTWRHVDINLRELFNPDLFPGSPIAIAEMELACYIGRYVSELNPGRTAGKGLFYCIDNFQIHDCPPDGVVEVAWHASDPAGVAGYSVVIDTNAATEPPEAITDTTGWAEQPFLDRGRQFLHIRAVDALGNWGAAVHYPLSAGADRTRSLASREAELLQALAGQPVGTPQSLRAYALFAERFQKLGKHALAGQIREGMAWKLEKTQQVQLLRAAMSDYVAAGDFALCRAALYRYFSLPEDALPPPEHLRRIVAFVRQTGSFHERAFILEHLAESVGESRQHAAIVELDGLARMHLDQRDFATAAEIARTASHKYENSPEEALALDVLATAYAAQGKRDELLNVCHLAANRFAGSAAHANAALLLTHMDREAMRFADAPDVLRTLLDANPPLETLRKAVPEMARLTWEATASPVAVENFVASLLDVPAEMRANRLVALRLAFLALLSDGHAEAAQALCMALIQEADAPTEAQWAAEHLTKSLTNPASQ